MPVVVVVPLCLLYALGLGYPPVFDDLSAAQFSPRWLRPAIEDGVQDVVRWFSNLSFVWTIRLFGFFLPLMRLQNLLVHCVNVVLLYLLLKSLFDVVSEKTDATRSPHRWWSALGAVWFGFNPAAVYAVAYLIQRSILMATGFSLLAMYCWVKALCGERKSRRAWGLLALVSYMLAVLSKEHAILLPALMAVAAVVLLPGRPAWQRWGSGIVIAGACAIVLVALRWELIAHPYEGHALAMLSMEEVILGRHLIDIAYPLSALTQCGLFFKYLGLWLLPLPQWMSVDMHPPLFVQVIGWKQALFLCGFLLWGGVGLQMVRRGGVAGLAGLGMLWPWLLFATELATVRVQEPFVLYRSYLWMAGVPAALPLLLGSVPLGFIRLLLPALMLGLLPLARDRHATFSSNFSLWSDAVEKSDSRQNALNGRAWMYRGIAKINSGDLDGATRDMEEAIRLDPWFAEPYANLSVILLRQGRFEEALRYSDMALKISPKLENAQLNRRLIVRLMKRKK